MSAAPAEQLRRAAECLRSAGFDAGCSRRRSFAGALRTALREAGLGGGRVAVAVEPVLPAVAERVLRESHPAAAVHDATVAILEAQAVKTAREIELLRNVVALADVAQGRS